MIPRYSRPEMTALWEPEARFRIWLEIETLAAEAMGGGKPFFIHAPADAAKQGRAFLFPTAR